MASRKLRRSGVGVAETGSERAVLGRRIGPPPGLARNGRGNGPAESRARAAAITPWDRNFRRSILSCINADFCDQILILQRFSSSTRFSHFCTARNSDFHQNFVKFRQKFARFCKMIVNFIKISQISQKKISKKKKFC